MTVATAFGKLLLASLDCESIVHLRMNDQCEERERKIAELRKKAPIE